MKRVIPVFVVLVVGLGVVLYLQLSKQEEEANRASRGSATIEGTEVDVVSRLPARVASITVREGERVKAGDVVVMLDCAEPDAALAQAEAAVEAARAAAEGGKVAVALAEHGVTAAQAQTEAAQAAAKATRTQRYTLDVKRKAAKRAAGRVEKLASSGSASEQDLDRVRTEAEALAKQLRTLGASASAASKKADAVSQGEGAAAIQADMARVQLAAADKQVAVAEAARERAKVAVAECRLAAPRGGIVTRRSFEPGEVVMPGSRVLTLVDIDEVRATFYLPNAELSAAVPGRAVEVVADAVVDRVFAGTIRRVGAEAEFTPRNVQTRDDRDRLVYAVEVSIPNADGALRPGMPVEIEIPGTEKK